MSTLNKMMLVGYLGRTPELKQTPKGTPVLSLSIATNREFKNAEGEKQKETTWHRASVWGKQAELCAKYLTKGNRVYVEGPLLIDIWEDPNGQKRKMPEIYVEVVKFLGGPNRSEREEIVNVPMEQEVALAQ